MAFSFGAKCAKGVLISFNLVFWLSGCSLIAFGSFILIEEDKSTLFPLFNTVESYADLRYLAFGLIGIGALVVLVGFFGCFGAMQEHKIMLVTYFIFLLIILGAELAVGILAIHFQHQTETDLEENLKQVLKKQYGVDDQTTKAIDLAQTKFQCCGISSPSDYFDSVWSKNEGSGKTVASTCCVLMNVMEKSASANPQPMNQTLCQREDAASNQHFRHHTGCLHTLIEFIKAESTLFIAIGCGIAFLQIFGMIFSICLCKEI